MISRRTGLTATAAALLAGAAGPAAAATRPAPAPAAATRAAQHRLRTDADAIVATGATGVVAEVQSALGSRTASSGTADLADPGTPVPRNASYRIGSDTKTFTATLALQLVGEGRLALDDTVERWLPGTVRGNGNDGTRITVRDLLGQTSGLNDYLAVSPDAAEAFTPEGYHRSRFRSQTAREQVAAALSRPPQWLPDPVGSPGGKRRWGYSNTNYTLMGLVIEEVTGHPWAQEIHDRIIEPLGLRHTFSPGTSPYVPAPTATAYTRFPGEDGFTDTTLAYGGGADGCLISDTHDHGRFLRALMGGRLLRPAQLAAMKETVAADDWIDAPGVRYGLGIAWRPVAGSRGGVWFHGGTHLGVVSESGVTPDGERAATSATFTLRMGGAGQDAQDRAARRLVDRALTGRW
ncbi:serine hydrolase domain-containing protein [Streptomyces sp. NBC_01237]|uniref:serine hydrolase domain-containing protein n=1 Tax=Streptomyces sp. NBC_01237 TaxID=2903790 RepID=UPI002DDC645F|nr:serine hydrolase domain-containing protein [Streptomyces sp. NBC_01237]WRZ72457.1 beta-lactamase family protein [Streptomyces sp. NBC_01237]